MKQIKFSETEIGELKNFYQMELDKAAKRVEDIKNIIAKLKPGEAITNSSRTGKRGRPRTVSVSVPKVKKQNRKPKTAGRKKGHSWIQFVPEVLKREKKYLTINEVATLASKKYNIAPKDRDKLVKSLGVTLPRLAKQNKLSVQKRPGSIAKFYGLPSWAKDKKKPAAAPVSTEVLPAKAIAQAGQAVSKN